MTGTDISKWADTSMFTAEPSSAAEGPKAFLLGGPADPLGQIYACGAMYKGEVVRDLADVTDDQRRDMLKQILKTVLGMPLEAVQLHFMIEGVTRGFTHQMVRQRTAAYAQESTRFAVKEDMREATALPPSLEGTLSLEEFAVQENIANMERGFNDALTDPALRSNYINGMRAQARGAQAQRFEWDDAVKQISQSYLNLVNTGMPAEDARGLMPTNITTRLNYITNLRNWYNTMDVRVSDQAQFEWRGVAMQMVLAMRAYGAKQFYQRPITQEEDEAWQRGNLPPTIVKNLGRESIVQVSSEWQYIALTEALYPIEFKLGGVAFGADFDRPSRIRERVIAFSTHGVPSSEWTKGSEEYGIPPINPAEWLLDPNSARLASGMEFDIFGNRVPIGTGWHYDASTALLHLNAGEDGWYTQKWPEDFDADGK